MSESKDTTPIEFRLESPPANITSERRAKRLAYERAWREANPGKIKAWRDANKDARKMKNKAYNEANKKAIAAKKKARHERTKGCLYGLSQEEYVSMVRACSGRCPCCKVPFSDLLRERPCVDHFHGLGRVRKAVRGIVCHRCNFVLGHANDDPRILEACARHLRRFKDTCYG